MTIGLSIDEVLALQELIKNSFFEGHYQWESEIYQALDKKFTEAYTKPSMTESELQEQLILEREFWEKSDGCTSIANLMVAAKRKELEFHYNIIS